MRVECSAGSALLPPPPAPRPAPPQLAQNYCTLFSSARGRAAAHQSLAAPPPRHAAFSTQLLSQAGARETLGKCVDMSKCPSFYSMRKNGSIWWGQISRYSETPLTGHRLDNIDTHKVSCMSRMLHDTAGYHPPTAISQYVCIVHDRWHVRLLL